MYSNRMSATPPKHSSPGSATRARVQFPCKRGIAARDCGAGSAHPARRKSCDRVRMAYRNVSLMGIATRGYGQEAGHVSTCRRPRWAPPGTTAPVWNAPYGHPPPRVTWSHPCRRGGGPQNHTPGPPTCRSGRGHERSAATAPSITAGRSSRWPVMCADADHFLPWSGYPNHSRKRNAGRPGHRATRLSWCDIQQVHAPALAHLKVAEVGKRALSGLVSQAGAHTAASFTLGPVAG